MNTFEDMSMQINQAKFEDNGQCGYVLKPNDMLSETLIKSFKNYFELYVEIISGRNLPKRIKSSDYMSEVFVEVELITSTSCEGSQLNNKYETKFQTTKSRGNGLYPLWSGSKNSRRLRSHDLDSAFIRFTILETDLLGKSCLIAQATHPLTMIRRGFRSVQLKNEFSECLELSTLLVHIEVDGFVV
jgi:phosphatidylinositol phospholipase C, gamma-1